MTIEAAIAEPHQAELPIAMVGGQPFTTVPLDLYIPPDALEVILETFQGPLDLLLYLIKKQNLDILNIPIAHITDQYIQYIELMQEMRLELAAEYLVMAAMLAEIKSRLLLPKPKNAEAEEEDPRAELIRRLQEYEQIKLAAEELNQLPQVGRDIFWVVTTPPDLKLEKPQPQVDLEELLRALKEVMTRAEMFANHAIQREPLSIRERMSEILERINTQPFTAFASLFKLEEGRLGVVVTFIAILELMKQSLIEIVQTEAFSPIHIKAVTAHE